MRKGRQHQRNEFLQQVGERIRLRRLQLQFSQEQLGEQCGVHRTYITEIENGLRNISLLTLYKLARSMEVEPWQLLMPPEAPKD